MHYWDDYVYIEIVDPKTLQPVPDGEEGEIVITTLVKEGAPLLRDVYKRQGLVYRVHRQTYGWETSYKTMGQVSGTTGEGKRLEGIEIALTGNEYSGSIEYSTHVQSYGWMNEMCIRDRN